MSEKNFIGVFSRETFVAFVHCWYQFSLLSVSSFLLSDMQLFDIVSLVGMTQDNIPVLENIRVHDHNEILTPGKLFPPFSIFYSLSGLSHDDVMHLYRSIESFFTGPVYHGDVPRMHDISHGFVSIIIF